MCSESSSTSASTSATNEFKQSSTENSERQQKTNVNPVPDIRSGQYVNSSVLNDPQFQSLLEYLLEDPQEQSAPVDEGNKEGEGGQGAAVNPNSEDDEAAIDQLNRKTI